jgi:asparagine synthase (glutamine-hydrolysing)
LILLYDKYGPEFLEKYFVNGMHAFAILDEKKGIYMAARDPLGIVPLY